MGHAQPGMPWSRQTSRGQTPSRYPRTPQARARASRCLPSATAFCDDVDRPRCLQGAQGGSGQCENAGTFFGEKGRSCMTKSSLSLEHSDNAHGMSRSRLGSRSKLVQFRVHFSRPAGSDSVAFLRVESASLTSVTAFSCPALLSGMNESSSSHLTSHSCCLSRPLISCCILLVDETGAGHCKYVFRKEHLTIVMKTSEG